MKKSPTAIYVLGLDDLDDQHHQILLSLALLHEALRDNTLTITEAKAAAVELRELWKAHAEYEESIMTKTVYPLREQHQLAHQINEAYFKMLISFPNTHTAHDMLQDFGNHILRYDRLYVKHFKDSAAKKI
jgi:hemerythrin